MSTTQDQHAFDGMKHQSKAILTGFPCRQMHADSAFCPCHSVRSSADNCAAQVVTSLHVLSHENMTNRHSML